jgi:single stranded DNA-binding protein
MLNLTLVGNLGADATVGATRKGTTIATMRVAVNHVKTDTTSGERTEHAEWFRVRAMGRLVELAQQLTKGTRVLVIGRLEIGHYQSSEGEMRVSHDVWADELIAFSPSANRSASGDAGSPDYEAELSTPRGNRGNPPSSAGSRPVDRGGR